MIKNLSNYSIVEIDNKRKEIEQKINDLKILKEKLEKYFDFVIPTYIIDDILKNEDYYHFCLMVNLAVMNDRLSSEKGEILKLKIKDLYNIKNMYDRF